MFSILLHLPLSTATAHPLSIPVFLKLYNHRPITRLFMDHSSLQSLHTAATAELSRYNTTTEHGAKIRNSECLWKKILEMLKVHHQYESVITLVFRGKKNPKPTTQPRNCSWNKWEDRIQSYIVQLL